MKLNSALSVLILSLALSSQAFALKTDRDQPAQLEADETEIDFKTGVRILTANVLVVQGTLRVKADKLVATYDKGGQLKKAIADGSLARFKQRPDGKPDDVEGQAKKIVVDYATNELTLIGKAALKQGASTARGEKIVYNMATDKLKIMGDSTAIVAGKDGKTAPKRKIKDSFKDDFNDLGDAEEVSEKTESGKTDTKKGDKKTKSAKARPTVEPVKAGRSRLILQPKKKVKVEEKDEEATDDKESNTDD